MTQWNRLAIGLFDDQEIGEIPADGERPAVERNLPIATLRRYLQICQMGLSSLFTWNLELLAACPVGL